MPGLGAVPELCGAGGRADPAPTARSCAPHFGGVGSEWLSVKWLKSWVAGEERGKGVARFLLAVLKFPSSEVGHTGQLPAGHGGWLVLEAGLDTTHPVTGRISLDLC